MKSIIILICALLASCKDQSTASDQDQASSRNVGNHEMESDQLAVSREVNFHEGQSIQHFHENIVKFSEDITEFIGYRISGGHDFKMYQLQNDKYIWAVYDASTMNVLYIRLGEGDLDNKKETWSAFEIEDLADYLIEGRL